VVLAWWMKVSMQRMAYQRMDQRIKTCFDIQKALVFWRERGS
jgi:hypothetical protein